ncbi:lytic transglycosylase domain-containing protein [Phenylobacterium sp. J367]|uniref:lytic transglycosylase domain-containing protein n=1 Tax=Phenylobacterium sp. J367 TaxID=2898435 RepID=UPI002150803E|nr:lytic transglycosylase domain-containing protein [Phenylobacterium sp. J367]MCR5879974.1 lytic transglycosylase domain-containing protein [Phenylobacterium sp. J367]
MTLVKRLCIGVSALACAASIAGLASAASFAPLSNDDARAYSLAFEAADRGDFIDAQMKTLEIKDPSLLGYVSFRQLMHPSAHKANYDELTGWLNRFRDLPLAERIFSLAAKRKPADAAEPPRPELSAEDMARLPQADRGFMARYAFYTGDVKRAAELAPAAGERWVAGLAAWRLKSYSDAFAWFADLAQDPVEDAWTRSAGAFWASRSAAMLGDAAEAARFLQLAAQGGDTFYGLIASRQLQLQQPLAQNGGAQVIRAAWRPAVRPQAEVKIRDFGAAPGPDPELTKLAAERPRAHRAAALVQIGRWDEARQELRAGLGFAANDKERDGWLKLIDALDAAAPRKVKTQTRPRAYWEYPTPTLEPKAGFTVDKALVYAITYQESRFNPQAVSHAGAIGLMQLLPESAARASGDDKLMKQPKRLFDPATNLKAGQDYLTWLMDRGVGYDILRMVAAYNGGPGAVNKALERVGRDDDPLLLIECLPAEETRDYVEKVMTAYWSYKKLWGQETRTLDALAGGARIIDARMDLPQALPAADAPAAELSAQSLNIGLD